MKRLVLLAVMAFSVSSTAFAVHGTDPRFQPIFRAELNSFGSLPGHNRIESGSIEIDFGRDMASLSLSVGFRCPRGVMCAQVMPAPFAVQLPVVESRTDDCGRKIVLARGESAGIVEELEIRDNSKNTCGGLLTTSDTEVFYSLRRADGRIVRSVFEGEKMIRVTPQRLDIFQ